MNTTTITIGLIVVALAAWFFIAQTDVDTSATDDTTTATATFDTEYSDDIARTEQEFAQAAAAIEADIEAGIDVSVETLDEYVNNVEAAAEAAGDEAAQAYTSFVASARAQIEAIRMSIPDVDVEFDAEVNDSEDGNSTAE